jgi:hypothetical protein
MPTEDHPKIMSIASAAPIFINSARVLREIWDGFPPATGNNPPYAPH